MWVGVVGRGGTGGSGDLTRANIVDLASAFRKHAETVVIAPGMPPLVVRLAVDAGSLLAARHVEVSVLPLRGHRDLPDVEAEVAVAPGGEPGSTRLKVRHRGVDVRLVEAHLTPARGAVLIAATRPHVDPSICLAGELAVQAHIHRGVLNQHGRDCSVDLKPQF